VEGLIADAVAEDREVPEWLAETFHNHLLTRFFETLRAPLDAAGGECLIAGATPVTLPAWEGLPALAVFPLQSDSGAQCVCIATLDGDCPEDIEISFLGFFRSLEDALAAVSDTEPRDGPVPDAAPAPSAVRDMA
jgi:hypothetical protein